MQDKLFKNFFKRVYHTTVIMTKGGLRTLLKRKWLDILLRRGNYYDFPIFIIAYNQYRYIQGTVNWLSAYGYRNITIIDNHSDYPPLLDFYKSCTCKVIRMKKNYGHRVFYKCARFWIKRNFSFYCLTDPDLMPIANCPSDFVKWFLNVMKEYPQVSKVGFSLKINDIPDDYSLKQKVIDWESRWYEKPITGHEQELYFADIDTTFALNSPAIFTPMFYPYTYKGVRTGEPYQARHLPWYETDMSEEIIYYRKTKKNGENHW